VGFRVSLAEILCFSSGGNFLFGLFVEMKEAVMISGTWSWMLFRQGLGFKVLVWRVSLQNVKFIFFINIDFTIIRSHQLQHGNIVFEIFGCSFNHKGEVLRRLTSISRRILVKVAPLESRSDLLGLVLSVSN
jgi:hypothetical protein